MAARSERVQVSGREDHADLSMNALKQLKALGGGEAESKPSSGRKKASVTDCCICLFSVTVCQSLFIA